VFPREERDLSKGLDGGAATPRFSTGYAAAQNRPAVLIETHMLKPYRTRVEATYAFLTGILQQVNSSGDALMRAVREADRRTIARGVTGGILPIRFGTGKHFTERDFLAIEARVETSAVSGGVKIAYTGRPLTIRVPFYDEVIVEDSASVPAGYAVPPEWTNVIEVLKIHGLEGRTLRTPVDITARSYRVSTTRFGARPYEGRQTVELSAEEITEHRTLPKGTFIVPTSQRGGNVLVHLLEPRGPDALAYWGFFNAIFEQKEYAEAYVMEAVGDTMLQRNPSLRAAYNEKISGDSSFAKNPSARLNWLYQHSPWADPAFNVYPVAGIVTRSVFDAVWRKAAE
jgi:hypothetical protein